MGRLTTIEDVEKRRENKDVLEREDAIAVEQTGDSSHASHAADVSKSALRKKSTAQAELEFHGLNNPEKRSTGHTMLIVAAVVVVIAVAVNFANYTLHFF